MKYFIYLVLMTMASPQAWGLPSRPLTPANMFAGEVGFSSVDSINAMLKAADRSSARLTEAQKEFAPLVRFVESLISKKGVRHKSEFIALCKKYRADEAMVAFILKKRRIDERSKKFILSQAKIVVRAWADVADEHRENLSALIAIGSLNVAINPHQELGHTFLGVTRDRLVKAEVLADKIKAYLQSLRNF